MCSYTLTHCLYLDGLCICVIHVDYALLCWVGGVIPCAKNQRYRDLPTSAWRTDCAKNRRHHTLLASAW